MDYGGHEVVEGTHLLSQQSGLKLGVVGFACFFLCFGWQEVVVECLLHAVD